MTDDVLLDNDVVLKTCCYDTVEELLTCITGVARNAYVLGVVKYVLSRAIKKRKSIQDKQRAADRLARVLVSIAPLEPSDEELSLAAEFEEKAQASGHDLDTGESQLLAILIIRSAALLLTGDKRAIRAMEIVVDIAGHKARVAGRVACLEQLVMALTDRCRLESLQAKICAEPDIDTALAICFSCTTGNFTPESVVRALASYINHVRGYAPNVLVNSNDLSAVISQEDGVG